MRLRDLKSHLRPVLPTGFPDITEKPTKDSNSSEPRDQSLPQPTDVRGLTAMFSNNNNNNTFSKKKPPNRPLPDPPAKRPEPVPTPNVVPQPPLPPQKSWIENDKGDSGRGSSSSDSSTDAQNSLRTNPTQREYYLDLVARKQLIRKYNDDCCRAF